MAPMRLTAIAALAASIQLGAAGAAFAADNSTGMMHGVGHGAGMKARCSPGDPNVMVNKATKTFMLDTKAKTAMKGAAADTAMAEPNSMGKKTSMVSMCKSEAMSMGAKMSGGGMMKKSGTMKKSGM